MRLYYITYRTKVQYQKPRHTLNERTMFGLFIYYKKGDCQMAEVLKIRFDEIEKIELIGGTKAQTLKNAVAGYSRKPDYVWNATHFDNSIVSRTYGTTITDTIVDDKWVNGGNYSSNLYTNEGIAFNDDGEMVFTNSNAALAGNWQSYIGGSPHIIKDSKICNEEFDTGFELSKAYRIGMGFNEKEIIVAFPRQKKTIKQLATYMKEQGADYAVALDGGGSVNVRKLVGQEYKHLDELNYNRAVSTFVCVWLKKSKPVSVEKQETVITKPKAEEVPTWNGKKAIGVYEVTWQTVNRRAGNGTNYALLSGPLKKGDKITVFDKKGTWVQSYGYWVSANALKLVRYY